MNDDFMLGEYDKSVLKIMGDHFEDPSIREKVLKALRDCITNAYRRGALAVLHDDFDFNRYLRGEILK
jgi:hypothetical protein